MRGMGEKKLRNIVTVYLMQALSENVNASIASERLEPRKKAFFIIDDSI